jgi:hypothetical protein
VALFPAIFDEKFVPPIVPYVLIPPAPIIFEETSVDPFPILFPGYLDEPIGLPPGPRGY